MIHDAIVHKITRRNPFLQDWPYYGIIDILNPTTTAQYQHSVTIPTKPGMLHDFRDLRFFQPDGSEIPFWIESKTDGSTAFVWLKPHSASNRQAYVFYGNREAVSQSNGDKVFDFFDDFLISLDSTIWDSSGTVTVSSSECSIAVNSYIASKSTFSRNIAIGAKIKTTNNAGWSSGFAWGDGVPLASHALAYLLGVFQNAHYWIYDNGSSAVSVTSTGVTATTGAYYRYEICMNAATGGHAFVWASGSARGSGVITETQGTLDGTKIHVGGHTTAATEIIDYVYTRKYTATEPVCQFNQSGLRNPEYR